MRTWRRRTLGLVTLGIALYLGLTTLARRYPTCLGFPYQAHYRNLSLYSDEGFDPEQGRAVLAEVYRRLSASPLFEPDLPQAAYLCNQAWHRVVLMPPGRRLGGVNYYPLTCNIFLGRARVYDDRVLSPEGVAVGGSRTLTYYLAHEFTHTLVARAGGAPTWLNEGYADFVGLGPGLTYAQTLETYRSRGSAYYNSTAERYLTYDVVVAYLCEDQGRDIQALLESPPDFESLQSQAGLR